MNDCYCSNIPTEEPSTSPPPTDNPTDTPTNTNTNTNTTTTVEPDSLVPDKAGMIREAEPVAEGRWLYQIGWFWFAVIVAAFVLCCGLLVGVSVHQWKKVNAEEASGMVNKMSEDFNERQNRKKVEELKNENKVTDDTKIEMPQSAASFPPDVEDTKAVS